MTSRRLPVFLAALVAFGTLAFGQQATSRGASLGLTSTGATKIYAATYAPPTMTVVDAASLAVIDSFPLPADPIALAADPTRNRVYVNLTGGLLGEWNTLTDQLVATHVVPTLYGMIEVVPDGSALVGVSGSVAGLGVVVVDLPGFTVRHDVIAGLAIWGQGFLATTPNSRFAWFSDTVVHQVHKIDLVHGGIVATTPTGGYPMGLDVSADGERVYVANQLDHSVSVLAARSGAELAEVPSSLLPIGLLTHSDGKTYVAGSFDGIVNLHDQAGAGLGTLAFPLVPYVLEELPDGRIAVVTWTTPDLPIYDPTSGVTTSVTLPGPAIHAVGIRNRRPLEAPTLQSL